MKLHGYFSGNFDKIPKNINCIFLSPLKLRTIFEKKVKIQTKY